MSSCTTTVPYSVRNSAPVGHTSRQPACVQCLQTSDDISQRTSRSSSGVCWPCAPESGSSASRSTVSPGAGAVGGVPGGAQRRGRRRAVGHRRQPGRQEPGGRVDGHAAGRAAVRRGRAAVRPDVLDERDVTPRRGAEVTGVVVGHPGEPVEVGGVGAVVGHQVPLLARHLAGLAADAHRGVGEEADALRVVARPPGVRRRVRQRAGQRGGRAGEGVDHSLGHVLPPGSTPALRR